MSGVAVTAALILAVKIAIGVLIFSIGANGTFSGVAYLWRRPSLLARSLIAMYVLVPLVAYAVVGVIPVAPGVKAALLVLAVSAGPPLLPRKLEDSRARDYAFSLVVATSLLAIIVVPAWVALMAWRFGVTAELSIFDVASAIAMTILLPLLLGLVGGAAAPPIRRLAEIVATAAFIALICAGLALIALHWQALILVRWNGVAALAVLMIAAAAIGHVLGGPNPHEQTTLAVACATRHIGVAAAVALTFPGPGLIVILTVYVLASTMVFLPYLRWRRRTPDMGRADA